MKREIAVELNKLAYDIQSGQKVSLHPTITIPTKLMI
jgi:hypothetical protein